MTEGTAPHGGPGRGPPPTPPPWPLLLGELAAPYHWWRGWQSSAAIAEDHDGGGRPVLLLPGFLADETRMSLLAGTLRRANYRAKRWKQGRNLGATPDLLDEIGDRIAEIHRRYDRPVALVGWSLGGIYAREAAKRAGAAVDQVVTLGSPIAGDLRANHAWRLYERVAGHPVDAPPVDVETTRPTQPTTALWSARDGIVAAPCARGHADDRDRAVEVDCTHMGFVSDPRALAAVLEVLSG